MMSFLAGGVLERDALARHFDDLFISFLLSTDAVLVLAFCGFP
jgi:hypothetical protein